MNAHDKELARAASALTPDDFKFLKEHEMLAEEEPEKQPPAQRSASEKIVSEKGAQDCSSEAGPEKERRRRKVDHAWPPVGARLRAEYRGARYEAEVIEAPRYKSGKAVRILSGPAAGKVERSMSGAMLTATEKQREEAGLGRSGVSNGWEFWKREEVPDEGED